MEQDDLHQPSGEAATALSERLVRGEVFSSDCPSRAILQHVTSRWGVLALVALARGEHRFSELRRKTGASERMLAQTLQRLESDGLVLRVSHPVVPPHVEYSLTPLGCEVALKVEALADWIEENLQRILTAQYDYAQRRQKGGAQELPALDIDEDAGEDLDR